MNILPIICGTNSYISLTPSKITNKSRNIIVRTNLSKAFSF